MTLAGRFPGHERSRQRQPRAERAARPGLADTIAAMLRGPALPARAARARDHRERRHARPERRRCRRCARCGSSACSLALDDFGTGYSSLAPPARVPARHASRSRSRSSPAFRAAHVDRVFIDAIVRLAASLGLEVVAEGIETPRRRNAVAELGCGYGQGFHFGSPLSQLGVAGYLGAATLPESPRVLGRVA